MSLVLVSFVNADIENYAEFYDKYDVLSVGETRTYEIDGFQYEVNLLLVNDGGAKFVVNGEVTDLLGEEDSFILVDGCEITNIMSKPHVPIYIDLVNKSLFGLNKKDVSGKPDLVIQNLDFVFQYKCAPDTKCGGQLSTIDFDIVNVGDEPTNSSFAIAVYIDGEIYTHSLFDEQIVGVPLDDPNIYRPIMPGESVHKSLSNYYWLNEGDHSITIVVDKLDPYDTQPNPLYDNLFDNMVDESNELNNKANFWMKQAHFVDTDLAIYPLMFIKDNKLDALVIVGDTSPASDVIAAVDLITGITNLGSGVHRIDVDAAVLDNTVKDLFSQNVILIGNTDFTKKLVGDFRDDLKPKLGPGMGYIRLLNQNGKYQLIVSGYDNEGTRKAARLLKYFHKHDIKGTQVLVDGTIENPFVVDIDSPDVPIIDVPIDPASVICSNADSFVYACLALDLKIGSIVDFSSLSDVDNVKGFVSGIYEDHANIEINNQHYALIYNERKDVGDFSIYFSKDNGQVHLYFYHVINTDPGDPWDYPVPPTPVIDVPVNPTGVPVESRYLLIKDFDFIKFDYSQYQDHSEHPFKFEDNKGKVYTAHYSHDVKAAVFIFDNPIDKKVFLDSLDTMSGEYYPENDYYVMVEDDNFFAVWVSDDVIVVAGIFNYHGDNDVREYLDTIDGELADLVGAYQQKYPPMGKPPVVHPVMPVNPVISIPTPVNPPVVVPVTGCVIDRTIVPIGFRTDDQYCSIDRDMVNQLSGGLPANNNFQCRSNLAVDGFCVEQGFFQRIISWFSRVFNF